MPAGFGMRPWLHAILVKKQVLWCQAFLPSFCQPNGSRPFWSTQFCGIQYIAHQHYTAHLRGTGRWPQRPFSSDRPDKPPGALQVCD